jgi:hypothetical protein
VTDLRISGRVSGRRSEKSRSAWKEERGDFRALCHRTHGRKREEVSRFVFVIERITVNIDINIHIHIHIHTSTSTSTSTSTCDHVQPHHLYASGIPVPHIRLHACTHLLGCISSTRRKRKKEVCSLFFGLADF